MVPISIRLSSGNEVRSAVRRESDGAQRDYATTVPRRLKVLGSSKVFSSEACNDEDRLAFSVDKRTSLSRRVQSDRRDHWYCRAAYGWNCGRAGWSFSTGRAPGWLMAP